MDTAAVSLKAGLVPLTTLHFNSSNVADIRAGLEQKQAEAPALFRHLPCVLDLSTLDHRQLTLADLQQICRDCGLLPVAVRNAGKEWQTQAEELHLADLGKGSNRGVSNQTSTSTERTQNDAPPQPRAVKIHTGNIRSGQQLYNDGDLIIFGMVSAGAEVLATGDIHIYGALRGRALAGVKGDESAIIACQQFDPELVAIAGQYRLFEDQQEQRQQPVAVSLQDGTLNITGV
ncbi:MAG: septum site-determining protein MinC [Saccharospirillaceae bacterium]|nr:septum site-determining protein MinC [Saccharospirillaceae bacterium]MCD8530545.1 septum site-determining protein MinC [Saccharospirillaceae bacterium]